jgi:hypothetical protein
VRDLADFTRGYGCGGGRKSDPFVRGVFIDEPDRHDAGMHALLPGIWFQSLVGSRVNII